MIYAIITIAAGLVMGGFLAVITTCKEAYDETLVCWGKADQ